MNDFKFSNEKGETALSVLVGAFIGSVIIGALALFYFTASDNSQMTAERTDQGSDAVKILNRAGRDISESASVKVGSNDKKVIVVQEKKVAGTAKPVSTTIQYGIEEDANKPGQKNLVRRVDKNGNGVTTDPVDSVEILGRNVVDSGAERTKFEYKTGSGDVTTDPSEAGLVDIYYVANTRKGRVVLKSSASVDSALGGSTTPNNGTAVAPDAVDDTSNVNRGSSTTVSVLSNDTHDGSPVVTVENIPAGVTAVVNAGNQVTVNVPVGYAPSTVTVTYRLTDGTGLSDTADIVVAVGNAPVLDAVNDALVVQAGTPLTGNVLTNDIRPATGTNLTVSGSAPSWVTVNPTTGAVSGTPPTAGTFTFTYTLTNSTTQPTSDTATVTVTVTAANVAVVATTPTASANCGPSNDQVTIPTVTGVQYRLGSTSGTVLTPGPRSFGAASITIVATALPGYTLNGTSSWSFTDSNVPCSVNVTASTPTYQYYCGPSNDQVYIPAVTGVNYLVGGSNVAAGWRNLGASSVTVTAQAQAGYTLSGTTSWSFSENATACPVAAAVTAYPEAAPTSISQTTGVNVVTWTGGPLTQSRIAGPATTPALLSGTQLTASSGTARLQVPLGTQYRYQVASVTDDAIQFPAPRTAFAVGSDTNNDMVPDTLGRNSVKLSDATALPSGSMIEVRSYKSTQSGVNTGTFESATGASFSQVCPAALSSVGAGSCYFHTGRVQGSEGAYVPILYTPAAGDVAQNSALASAAVFVGGVQYFPSYTRTHVAASPATYYTAANRAYQAPGAGPSGITAGNAQASNCTSTDGVPLVNAHPATTTNALYHCSTGLSNISYKGFGDDGGRTSAGAVNSSASTAAFCDYGLDPGQCQMRVVRGAAAPTLGPGSNTTNPTRMTSVSQSDWAVTDTYTLQVCNLGGCNAAAGTTRLTSFGGPFAFEGINQKASDRFKKQNHWLSPGCETGPGCLDGYNQDARMRMDWFHSRGIQQTNGTYRWDIRRSSGLANSPGREAVNQATGTTSNTGKHSVNPMTVYWFRVRATPVTSQFNGLMWRDSTSPSGHSQTTAHSGLVPISFVQDSAFCETAVNDGWRYGFVIRNKLMDHLGNNISTANVKVRFYWWVGRINGNTPEGQVGELAAAKWLLTSNPASWAAPGNWTNTTSATNRGTEYYNTNSNNPADNTYQMNLTGASTDRIPPMQANTSGGVGHIRVETYMTRATAGNPDFADTSYWTSLSTEGQYGGTNIYGTETRARAGMAAVADVNTCAGTAAGLNWKNSNGSTNSWKAMYNGKATTRRTHVNESGANSRGIGHASGLWNQVY